MFFQMLSAFHCSVINSVFNENFSPKCKCSNLGRKKRGRPPEHPDRSENNSPVSNSPELSGEGDMEVDQLHER